MSITLVVVDIGVGFQEKPRSACQDSGLAKDFVLFKCMTPGVCHHDRGYDKDALKRNAETLLRIGETKRILWMVKKEVSHERNELRRV